MNVTEELVQPMPLAAAEQAGLPIGSAVIGPDGGAPIGVVDKVAISAETGALTHLLIRCSGEPLRYILAPVAGVAAGADGAVQLGAALDTDSLRQQQGAAQHGYAPEQVLVALAEQQAPAPSHADADILARARMVLESYRPLRLVLDPANDAPVPAAAPADAVIRLTVRNGVAILSGNAVLSSYSGLAERLVRGVAGVRDVLNLLHSDDELRTSLLAALHHDPRTRQLRLAVRVALGRVTIAGSVPDAGSLHAAREVAASLHGVRHVVDQLRVRQDSLYSLC